MTILNVVKRAQLMYWERLQVAELQVGGANQGGKIVVSFCKFLPKGGDLVKAEIWSRELCYWL